jgi:hypothetical protein
MACLQKIFSLSLLLSCSLGFLVVDGFVVSPFRRTSLLLPPGSNTAIESTIKISSSGADGRQRCRLNALKKSNKKSSTAASSNTAKIQEMAAFLSVTLLEKVIAETMKEGGESNMDLDAIQRITDALQNKPSSETKQEEESTSTAAAAAAAKLETTTTTTTSNSDAEDKLATKESIEAVEIPASTNSVVDNSASSKIAEDKNKDDASKKEKKIPPLEIVAADIPPLRPSSMPKRESKSLSTLTEEVTEEEKETTQSSEIIIEDNKASSPLVDENDDDTNNDMSSDDVDVDVDNGVDVVDDILKQAFSLSEDEDGSNIDDDYSQNKDKNKKDEKDQEKEIPQKIESSKEEEIEVGNWAAPILPEEQIPGESFQRKLLEKQFEYNARATVAVVVEEKETTIEAIQLPTQDDSDSTQSTPLLEDVDVVNKEKSNEGDKEESSSSRSSSSLGESPTPKSEGKSYQSNRLDDVVQSKSSTSQIGSSSPSLTTTPSPSPSPISERRLHIMVARRQPKSPNEESKLAEKYQNMPIEERAYTILFDLGMIDENKDPKDPSYDHANDDEYCDQTYISSL